MWDRDFIYHLILVILITAQAIICSDGVNDRAKEIKELIKAECSQD